jgi:hypothetical protein
MYDPRDVSISNAIGLADPRDGDLLDRGLAMDFDDRVAIELPKGVALVVFDYLTHYFEAERSMEAEDIALSQLREALEGRLVEPMLKDYMFLLNEAKRQLYVGHHGP